MLYGVVRHTERADANFALCAGDFWVGSDDQKSFPHDPPLSDDGLEAAREVGIRVANFVQKRRSCIDVVITSPYKRCIETALEIKMALGDDTGLLIDRSLGEVYNADSLGCVAEPHDVVRPFGSFCAEWENDADTVGEWPRWGETVEEARMRYASNILSYLRRGADATGNFIVVSHAECVASTLSIMPFSKGRCISSVKYGGMFLAKSLFVPSTDQIEQFSRQVSPSSPTRALHGWQVMKHNVRTTGNTGRNLLLTKASNVSAVAEDDIQALISTGVRATPLYEFARQTSTMTTSSINTNFSSPGTPASPGSPTRVRKWSNQIDDDFFGDSGFENRQISEASMVFQKQVVQKRRSSRKTLSIIIGQGIDTRNGSPSSFFNNDDGSSSPTESNYSLTPTASPEPSSRNRTPTPAQTPCQDSSFTHEEEWWSDRSVILCDGNMPGFPICVASVGFQKLFELTEAECLGKSCGDLVRPDRLLEAMTWPSLQHMCKVLKDMLSGTAETESKTQRVLLLNRKNSGKLFVNEVALHTHRHAVTGGVYVVGIQDDVSHQISVEEFMKSCESATTYAELLRAHEKEGTLLDWLPQRRLSTDALSSFIEATVPRAEL